MFPLLCLLTKKCSGMSKCVCSLSKNGLLVLFSCILSPFYCSTAILLLVTTTAAHQPPRVCAGPRVKWLSQRTLLGSAQRCLSPWWMSPLGLRMSDADTCKQRNPAFEATETLARSKCCQTFACMRFAGQTAPWRIWPD